MPNNADGTFLLVKRRKIYFSIEEYFGLYFHGSGDSDITICVRLFIFDFFSFRLNIDSPVLLADRARLGSVSDIFEVRNLGWDCFGIAGLNRFRSGSLLLRYLFSFKPFILSDS